MLNTIQINEHFRNALGILPVTHDNQSSYTLTITSYARHREHLKAFANACKHYKINEHSRNTSGVLSVSSTIIIDYFGLVSLHLNLSLLRTRAMVNT